MNPLKPLINTLSSFFFFFGLILLISSPQIFAEEPSAKTTTEIYQDWQYSCVEKNASINCEVVQSAVNNQGGVVSQLSAIVTPEDTPQLQIILPHFVNLQKDVALDIPDQIKLSVEPLFCDPRACYILLTDNKLFKSMKEGNELLLDVDLISGEKLKISYSLSGFGSAFDRLLAAN